MAAVFLIVGLVILGVPLMAILALVQASGARSDIARLSDQVRLLRRELQELRDDRRKAPLATAEAAPSDQSTRSPGTWDRTPRGAASELAVSAVPAAADAPADSTIEQIETGKRVPAIESAVDTAIGGADAQEAQTPLAPPALSSSPIHSSPEVGAADGDVEKAVATRWTIWIGGVALAMGGVLIVRYSIEAGFFGPATRLLMGAVFSIMVAALAEFIRRRDLRLQVGDFPSEQVPSVLAGVSVVSGFGVIYAANGVYGLLGSAAAFTIMGVIGVSALLVSLVYGSGLGLLGLVGSYLTPFFVSGAAPNYPALSVFVALVTLVAFGIDVRRRSTALLAGAIVGHNVWTALIAMADGAASWGAFLVVAAAVVATLGSELTRAGTQRRAPADRLVRVAAFGAPLTLASVLWVHQDGDTPFRLALVALLGANVAASVRTNGLAVLAPIAGAAATGLVLLWPAGDGALGVGPSLLIDLLRLDFAAGVAPGLSAFALLFFVLVSLPLVLALVLGYRNAGSDPFSRGCIAFASALTPVCITLAASLRLNGFDRSTRFALLAAVLAFGLGAVSELLFRRERRDEAPPETKPLAYIGSAAHAAAAAIAIGLAIAFALRETWLMVGFAIASAGVALIARARPVPLLRGMAAALGTAAFGQLLRRPVLADVGTLPLLNWLIVAYGLPTLAFAVAATALSRRRDRALKVSEALASFFFVAFVMLEIAQAFVGPDLSAATSLLTYEIFIDPSPQLQDRAVGLLALSSIAAALLCAVFMKLRSATASPVYATAERLLAVAAVGIAVGSLANATNPLLNGMPVHEPAIFNRLLFGYIGTGLVLGLLSRRLFAPSADSLLRPVLEGLSILLTALGATLVLRHAFSGPYLRGWNGGVAGFYEAVSTALLWLTLAGMVSLWRGRRESTVLGYGTAALCVIAIANAIVVLGLVRNPLIDLTAVEGPIVFNRILWGYAPVAIGFLIVAQLVAERETWLARLLRNVGFGALALMVFLLARHGFHGPTLRSVWPVTLAESGFYGSVAMLAAMVTTFRDLASGRYGPSDRNLLSYAAAAVAVGVALLVETAYWGAPLVGWPFWNNATLGVLTPAILAAVASFGTAAWGTDRVVHRVYGGAAVAGGLFYLLLQVRLVFPEADLLKGWSPESGTIRFYAYSVVTLVYGIALLVAGLRLERRDLRMAALGVVALAVCKVFLLDLGGLEGLWRAASFIGLGANLIGIAYLYRWLMPPERPIDAVG